MLQVPYDEYEIQIHTLESSGKWSLWICPVLLFLIPDNLVWAHATKTLNLRSTQEEFDNAEGVLSSVFGTVEIKSNKTIYTVLLQTVTAQIVAQAGKKNMFCLFDEVYQKYLYSGEGC